MPIMHRVLGLSLVGLIASTGCRSSDPLSGTWSNDTCFGTESTPDDIESCGVTLTFTDDLEMSLAAEWVSLPATADYPGCITTKRVTGQSWSTEAEADFDVLFVDGDGTATVERDGCVNAEDDMYPTATSGISIPSGEIEYQISDDVLTILTSDLQGAYEG
jgi:hypothetical protein